MVTIDVTLRMPMHAMHLKTKKKLKRRYLEFWDAALKRNPYCVLKKTLASALAHNLINSPI